MRWAGCLALAVAAAASADEPRRDAKYPFRTDFANEHLPWYRLQPLEFPPFHSDHRVSGELVRADFLHRKGQFRETKTGRLVDFTLLPAAWVNYLNAPADLRDVPLGTNLLFFLYQDDNGEFTRAAGVLDDYTVLASHSFTYRLDEAKPADGKLLVTKQNLSAKQSDLGKRELTVTAATRVWKGGKPAKLADLAIGDALLVNLTGRTAASAGWCTDVWAGEETHRAVTAAQRAKHAAFVKQRGLPAQIDSAEKRRFTVTLLADEQPATRKALQAMMAADFPVGQNLYVCVANDELRAYRPIVDRVRCRLARLQAVPVNGYGTGGVRLLIEPTVMLEGFRKGRFVRVFGEKWPIAEMPMGECFSTHEVYSAEANEVAPKEYPDQFPYRTDHGNAHLPWFRFQPGKVPPRYSEHQVYGELVKVDAAKRAGQFREDRTGKLVDFTLTQEGALVYVNTNKVEDVGPTRWDSRPASVLYLDAETDLKDMPLGTRYCFHMYQDEKGEFTRASLITDEFTELAVNKVVYRVEAIKLAEGQLHVARQISPKKDYQNVVVQPPDVGRAVLLVGDATRVWKGGMQVKLTDLTPGDLLLVNQTGEQTGKPARCTDVWVGRETHKLATETQRKKRPPAKR
jgi:hypothetical protein